MKSLPTFVLIFLFLQHGNGLYQGTGAPANSARFIASIRYRNLDHSFGSGFLCAASVINNFNVVTAASCVYNMQPSQINVAFGRIDLNSRYVVINIAQIRLHPKFDISDIMNDNIAVVRVTRNIRANTNAHIQIINLDSTPVIPSPCSFFAWGLENRLLRATIPVNSENCHNQTDSTFCAGNVGGGPALCPRNLGGAYVCNSQLTGIAISVSGCTQPGTTGRLVAVNNYRDWILRGSAKSTCKLDISLLSLLLIAVTQFLFI
ncbi:CLUMA_CG015866, isoform A [Clunio marinus]|uniref:CLUMA_CG015866, isoform A n=1 Tax=Clunio marinus TaxID=568069 RepID=A0A1J1IUL1_9DIPT|nr:CLUMA_CG015866, isoform A [Clunio marinus]